MSYDLSAGMGASYYRRFASDIAVLHRAGELQSFSVRLSADFAEDLDNIAKHFNVSRNSFIVDVLFSGLQHFQNDFAEQCYDAGDPETLQAFIDARGHKLRAQDLFDKIRDQRKESVA